jgi:hypothetical protein
MCLTGQSLMVPLHAAERWQIFMQCKQFQIAATFFGRVSANRSARHATTAAKPGVELEGYVLAFFKSRASRSLASTYTARNPELFTPTTE